MGTYERQLQLEEQQSIQGIERYRAMVAKAVEKGNEHRTDYAQLIMRRVVGPMEERIAEWLAEQEGKSARRASAYKYLQRFSPDLIAAATMRTLLDRCTQGAMYTATAMQVATVLETEERAGAFEREHRGILYNMIKTWDGRGSHAAWRRTSLIHKSRRFGTDTGKWPYTDKLHVGRACIEMMLEATGLWEVKHMAAVRSGTKAGRQNHIVAKPELIELCDSVVAKNETMHPAWMPMVVPPLDWTTPYDGGYLTTRRLQLIKGATEAELEEINNDNGQLTDVYAAVNAVQRTGWVINREVLSVAQQLWRLGGGVAGMPPAEDLPLPPKADDLDTDSDEFLSWKRDAAEVHIKNAHMMSNRLSCIRTLKLAEMLEDEEALYFPCQLDFRGRMYTVPLGLGPQGNDLQKGMLTFAEGKPIEDLEAARWLAVHGANCYGVDKVSFEDRWQWVEDHHDAIMFAATDPLDNTFWMDADDPFQFLAWCLEWAAFQDQGFGYVSSLPVALDGSCNGLQHYSAMLRDPRGGAAVNLLPAVKPADIYSEVASVVVAKLHNTSDIESDPEGWARRWLQLDINRKTVKRAVMTLPYGSTKFSCRRYIEEWLREQQQDVFGRDDMFKASRFLCALVWDAIGEVVVAAREAMDWIQKAARVASKDGLPLQWTTPDGFPVMQRYIATKDKRVKTKLGDTLMYLTLRIPGDTLDARRQANGAAPNFVHSLDATAMRIYTNMALDNGINHFAMVHDSFGTHAADTEMASVLIREAFVDTYQDSCPLTELRDSLAPLVEGELPPLPETGDLSVEDIRDAVYFFA